MLRSDMGPQKITEKSVPLARLSSKHSYIKAVAFILKYILFSAICVFCLTGHFTGCAVQEF